MRGKEWVLGREGALYVRLPNAQPPSAPTGAR